MQRSRGDTLVGSFLCNPRPNEVFLPEWSPRHAVRGLAAYHSQSDQDNDSAVLARRGRGVLTHVASGYARMLPNFTRSAECMETAAAAGGLEAFVEQSLWATGAAIMCLSQLGRTWPHETTFVTASGHEVALCEPFPYGCRDADERERDSLLAHRMEWADCDERTALLRRPLLERCPR